MSISAISSNLVNDLSQQQNPFRQIRQDFKQLASALQSGSLSDAQSAYSNIEQVLQASQGSGSSGTGASLTPLQNDFATLGQALQSGDLSQAQSVFSQLKTDGSATAVQPAIQTQPVQAQPVQDQYVPSSQGQSLAQQAQQDYSQLASALQTGSLTNAQSAFAALNQVLQTQAGSNTSASAATNTGGDAISSDLNSLGAALSSGSLSQAQSSFSQLQSDINTTEQANATASSQASQASAPSTGTAVEGHHHHHHHGGESESASSTSTAADSSSTSTTGTSTAGTSTTGTVNLTVNIYG